MRLPWILVHQDVHRAARFDGWRSWLYSVAFAAWLATQYCILYQRCMGCAISTRK